LSGGVCDIDADAIARDAGDAMYLAADLVDV
jgi:hypothetical protein